MSPVRVDGGALSDPLPPLLDLRACQQLAGHLFDRAPLDLGLEELRVLAPRGGLQRGGLDVARHDVGHHQRRRGDALYVALGLRIGALVDPEPDLAPARAPPAASCARDPRS